MKNIQDERNKNTGGDVRRRDERRTSIKGSQVHQICHFLMPVMYMIFLILVFPSEKKICIKTC